MPAIKIKFNPDISLPITFKASLLQGSVLVLTVSMPVTHNYSLWAQTAPEKWNQKGHLAWHSVALRSVALGLNGISQNHFGHLVAGAEFLRWVREVKHFPMQDSLWGRRQEKGWMVCSIVLWDLVGLPGRNWPQKWPDASWRKILPLTLCRITSTNYWLVFPSRSNLYLFFPLKKKKRKTTTSLSKGTSECLTNKVFSFLQGKKSILLFHIDFTCIATPF